jgi:hypothetical protein
MSSRVFNKKRGMRVKKLLCLSTNAIMTNDRDWLCSFAFELMQSCCVLEQLLMRAMIDDDKASIIAARHRQILN